jgi:tRNA dimethylallyltransferase
MPERDARQGPFIVLTGPTAAGKTDVSLKVAERLKGEIVSADSRQIYRGLDVGTAKPSPGELARVPHHFIDEKDLGEPFSAGRFAAEAEARIAEILARGGLPVVAGGSTLYVEALVHGLANIPDVPPEVRIAVEQRLADEGAETLYAELLRLDPAAAATLDATKTQRLVRALEVLHHTGTTLSEHQRDQSEPAYRYRVFVLTRPREVLYQRINARVDQMLAHGLLDENRRLLADGVSPDLNPLRTIGYQEPLAHLRGEIEYDEMVRLLKRNTRRYAKRQLTWFRRHEEYTWLDLEGLAPGEAPDAVFRADT